MTAIRVLTYKSAARFLRNRTAVALTFIVPLAMIYIFGQVFGLTRAQSGPSGIRLAVVNDSPHAGAQKLVAALKAEKAFEVWTYFVQPDKTRRPLTEDDARRGIREGAFRFAVVIPEDVIPKSGFGLHLKIFSNPQNDIEAQMVNGILQKTIFTTVPEMLGASLQNSAKEFLGDKRFQAFNAGMADAIATAFGADKAAVQRSLEQGDFGLAQFLGPEGKAEKKDDAAGAPAAKNVPAAGTPPKKAEDFLARLVKIDNEQVVGADVKSPAATRVVGGWAIMFLMFALNGAATSLFEEKKSGIFQRLLAAPVSRADILWSRFIFGVGLGLVQLVAIFIGGKFLYGIDVFGHLGNLAVVCLAAAAACTALGMLIAAVATSQEAAMGLATFVVLTMSAVGGAWFPLSLMPPFMQEVAKFTVTYWAMQGFADVLWAGKSFTGILPTVGTLLAITAGLMGVAVWRFNRNKLFE
jgi:ABC-2 type transport system permease protein